MILSGALLLLGLLALSGCGTYNNMVEQQEQVNQAWAQVENVYQRRLDLIPNLVETVKGYAAHEQEVLIGVTEARAKLGGQVNLDPSMLSDPQQLEQFQAMQASITSALQRLMVVVEQYPELKADRNFLELQAQLEGTENRIAVERRRFNEAVQSYNTTIKKFPAMIFAGMFGFSERAYFQGDPAASKAPEVKF
ncbi:MAG TPA: LemA family protein [Calditrichia bacterium]|nr:LemA family protein [Calditrichia bacterium]HQV31736.1 LemA family protein [Calditrichia bacterium]